MALAALVLGIRAAGSAEWNKTLLARRVAILGGAAIVGWLGTNPYAVITPYYFNSWVTTWRAVGTSSGPFGTVSLWDWIMAIYGYIGPLGSALALAGLIRALIGGVSTPQQRAFFLAATLSLSQVAYYGLLGKLWFVLGYLLVALALTATLALDGAIVWLQFILSRAFKHASRQISAICIALASIFLGTSASLASVNAVLELHLRRESTLLAFNNWAVQGGIPPDARVVFDDLAYLDPKVFKNARMYGGV